MGAGLEVRLRSASLLTAFSSGRSGFAVALGLVEEEKEALRREGEEEEEEEAASEFSDFFNAFQLLPAPPEVEAVVADLFIMLGSDEKVASNGILLRAAAGVCAGSEAEKVVAVYLAMRL